MRRHTLLALFLFGAGTASAQSKPLERVVAGTSTEARADHFVQGGVRLFFVRTDGGATKLFVQGPGGNQRAVFDPSTVEQSTLAWADIGDEGSRAIVGLTHGAETEAVVIDAKTGKFGPDRLAKATTAAWLSSTHVVYRERGGKAKTARVHALGTDVGKDITIPVPSDAATVTTALGSSLAIAAVLDETRAAKELYTADSTALSAKTKWHRITDPSVQNVTSYALDGTELYFVNAASPTVLRQLVLAGAPAKSKVIVDTKSNITAIGVTGKTVVYTTSGSAAGLWELRKGAVDPKTIALPTGVRATIFTDPRKQEVLVTTTASDGALALYRFANGQLTPIPVGRAPAAK